MDTRFPADLVRLQDDLHRTYAALATPCPADPTALRRRLRILSNAVRWHPYWSGPQGTATARTELRRRAREEQIVQCVREWILEHGEGPTVREISRHTGLSSPSSVACHLHRLEKERSVLIRSGPGWRTCRLVR